MGLMCATSQQSPFGFIVFDNPIQSMDDNHTESFIVTVLKKLIRKHGKQVIVLSHDKIFTNMYACTMILLLLQKNQKGRK